MIKRKNEEVMKDSFESKKAFKNNTSKGF